MNCGNTSLSGLSSVIPGLETESLEFNTTVRYECLTGHNKSRGDYERICLATGSWSGQALECTGKWLSAFLSRFYEYIRGRKKSSDPWC